MPARAADVFDDALIVVVAVTVLPLTMALKAVLV